MRLQSLINDNDESFLKPLGIMLFSSFVPFFFFFTAGLVSSAAFTSSQSVGLSGYIVFAYLIFCYLTAWLSAWLAAIWLALCVSCLSLPLSQSFSLSMSVC